MAKTEDIWNEIVTILNSARVSGQPLEYVKVLSQGITEDIAGFPAIVLEPIREAEVQATIPQNKQVTFDIRIACILEALNKDKQIIGGTGATGDIGILDFVRDVKNVLNANRTLNNKCLKFDFTTTDYIYETYPFRSAEITMSIQFITTDTNR